MEENTEKQFAAFPVNEQKAAGVIIRESFNDNENRANVTLMISQGGNSENARKNKTYINVLISGKERYENFKANFNNAKGALGENEHGPVKPCMFVTGQVYFSTNKVENEGKAIYHNNVSLIANGECKENTPSFYFTKDQNELDHFRKTFHSNNPEINQVNLRCKISSEVKSYTNDKGKTTTKFNVGHTYVKQDDSLKTMYTQVVVPDSMKQELSKLQPEKELKIMITGKITPSTYENKDGVKVATVAIIPTSMQRDFTRGVSVEKSQQPTQEFIEKATAAIDKVAETPKKGDRLAEAEKQKETLNKQQTR